jgi:dynein intermediate chain 2, axonemal
MDPIEVIIKKNRRAPHEKPTLYTWTEPTMLSEVAPNPIMRAIEYMLTPHVETEIQNVPQLSNASTNTDVVAQTSRGMKHTDGGWPNNVDVEEREGRSKHCKKVEREEGYLAACSALATTMKPFLRLNCALDIFEVYDKFSKRDEPEEPSPTQQAPDTIASSATPQAVPLTPLSNDPLPPPLSVTMKFAAPSPSLRVSQVAFTCGSDSEWMVVGYVEDVAEPEHEVPPSTDEPCLAAAVWSLSSCVAPAFTMLSAVGGCTTIATCPKDPYHVVGGSANGIVQVWELRDKGAHDDAQAALPSPEGRHFMPTSRSHRLTSHRDSVTDVKYIMSKGVDLMTTSIDGRVLFWDLRNMSEPLYDETLELLIQSKRLPGMSSGSSSPATVAFSADPEDGASDDDPFDSATLTPCCVDYDPMVGGVQQYLVGTAEGFVLSCTRRAQRNSDRILQRYQASLSSVFCAQRCAVLPKIFLTIGDWGWRLFGDELLSPIMSSAPRLRQVTCGRWHTTRPSIIFTGTSSGHLEMWDLLEGVCSPKVDVKVSDAPLRHCVPHASGRCVAVSDAAGHVYLLQLSEEYHTATSKERAAVVAVLEREFSRERMQQAQRNIEPQQAIPVHEDMIAFGIADSNDSGLDATLSKLTETYLALSSEEPAQQGMSLLPSAPAVMFASENTPDTTSIAAKLSPIAREAARRRSSIDRAPIPEAANVFDTADDQATAPPATLLARKPGSGKQKLGRF